MYERISPLSVCMHLRTVNFYQAWAPLFQLMSTRTFQNFFPMYAVPERERIHCKKGYHLSCPQPGGITNQNSPWPGMI